MSSNNFLKAYVDYLMTQEALARRMTIAKDVVEKDREIARLERRLWRQRETVTLLESRIATLRVEKQHLVNKLQ